MSGLDLEAPSRSQVEKAGKRLRRIFRGELPRGELRACLEIIERHRQTHTGPMLNANNGMRRYAQAAGVGVQVTQRLKRMETIVAKLTDYESKMNLSRMRDIGGVRLVVDTLNELRSLQAKVVEKRRRYGVEVIDYVAQPRRSGYRAVHLICTYSSRGVARPVEVQLRTRAMHAWADMVEQVSSSLGVNHKKDGYTPFHRWALLWSRRVEAVELGQPSPVTDADFKRAWDRMLEGWQAR